MRAALVAVLLAAVPFTAGAQWVEGTHYEILGPAERRDDGRVEVVYVFWYGCPTCFNLEPHVRRWRETLPDDVVFTRIAGSMAPSWRVHSRAYYTAEHLGVVDRVHGRIFDAIHLQRQPLNTVDSIATIFVEHGGVDRDAFMSAFNSFTVDARMRRGDQRTRTYRLSAVPALVVAGRYRTDPGRAQGYENTMRVVDHLIQLERRERAATPEVR